MAELLDIPGPVRAGEELDAEKLQAFLREAVPGLGGPLEIWQFTSGYSNLTYLLRAGETELVLRRPPVGSTVKAAHDMSREYRVLSALRPVYPAVPKPVAYCDDPGVLGAPFYVMERVRGVILRGKRPAGLSVAPELVRNCCESLVRGLAELHAIDYAAAGLADLQREGSFVARNVRGWVERYRNAETDEITGMDATAAWLLGNFPHDSGAVLIHNDFKFDNLVLDPADWTRIIGVLDWEMCSIGDPFMDLGVALSYWMEPDDVDFGMVPCFLTREPGAMTRRGVADRYMELTGRHTDNLVFYNAFGLFKLAVIAQQIYYRHRQGLTKDPRFGGLIMVVAALGMRAAESIETGVV
ncbi:MAG: phosphotransferase family protein [Candidatus Hydrogenedens sp.]|nr:phosphotransferase family protein [Candidatus Hydrogenedentota bacterium]NLF57366.1 phosphotransferase family protein [Candidatus Hydrogenedens sp.]